MTSASFLRTKMLLGLGRCFEFGSVVVVSCCLRIRRILCGGDIDVDRIVELMREIDVTVAKNKPEKNLRGVYR